MPKEPSIVLELQRLALDNNHDLTDLLRKALVIAMKLRIEDFREWIESELNGYQTNEIPDYRKCYAEIKVENPFHGLIPMTFEHQETQDLFCNVKLKDSIGGLIDLLKNQRGLFTIPLNAAAEKFFNEGQGFAANPIIRIIGRNQIAAIVDKVRTNILNWALTLEQEGILGEGLTFSQEEKNKAATSMQIQIGSIGNYQGFIGSVNESVVNQHLTMEIKQGDFESLKDFLVKYTVPEEDVTELEAAIKSGDQPTAKGKFGPKVSAWMGKMVQKAASGVWNVSISAASSIISRALMQYYGMIPPTAGGNN